MNRHYTIQVFGKVQGVGFRFSAKMQADKLGIAGFAKNMPDGSVYMEVEGEDHILDQFTSWCRKGPAAAKVSHTSIKKGNIRNYQIFEIL